MKYTKQRRFICLLILCAMLTGMLQPAAADIKAEKLLKRMGMLKPIPQTNLLIAQESKNNKWGLYDTDANIIIPLEHENIAYVSYRFLSVSSQPEETYSAKDRISLDKINCHALMSFDGKVLTDYVYGTFKAYSPQWAVGWVLEGGTSADHDYSLDKQHFCRIKRCDILYCGEDGDGSRLIASLTRNEFNNAVAHGDYLSVQSRQNETTVYGKNAETVDISVKNLKSSVYGIKNWMIVELPTGEMVMDGCSAVSEVQTENELLLLATRIDFQGRKLNSLITTKGEVVIPMLTDAISSVSRNYAVITSSETGKKGLYSLSEGRMVLPCEYDEILENKNSVDRFISHGYICVMRDELFYCYEVKTGKLVPVAMQEDPNVKLERNGAAFYATKKTGKLTSTLLISPDGKVKTLNCSIKKSRGSGYLIVASFSLGGSVVNWYGNNYLPQYYSNITITDDDHFIIKTKKSGYELYRIPE